MNNYYLHNNNLVGNSVEYFAWVDTINERLMEIYEQNENLANMLTNIILSCCFVYDF